MSVLPGTIGSRHEGAAGQVAGAVAGRAALELVAACGLIELDLWYLRGTGVIWPRILVYAALVTLCVTSYRRRRRTEPAETPGAGRGRAWAEALGTTGALVGALLVGAALVRFGDESFEWHVLGKAPDRLAGWCSGKFLAALGQQLALQLFLWPSCRDLLRNRVAGMVLAAAIFGLIHLPGPWLVGITAPAGLAWIALYRRSGRLGPLIASHIVLATLAHGALPTRLNYDMQVGIVALRDRPRFLGLYDRETRAVERALKSGRGLLRRYASADYYAAQGGTEEGFIAGLYRDVLGRSPGPRERDSWSGVLASKSRAEVAATFLAGAEARSRRR